MNRYNPVDVAKSDRISRLVDALYDHMPVIEADRAVLLTDSYMQTEGEPVILRRAKAFAHICRHLPITIREDELIVGSATKTARGCQVFPEFSFEWLESEFDTVEHRTADPFAIADDTKKVLHEVYRYWKGKTTSELATAYMKPETLRAIEHNIFTPGNYFYNGIGHLTVQYDEVLAIGFEGIREKARKALDSLTLEQGDYNTRSAFLQAVILTCDGAMTYARRYAQLALETAENCSDEQRKRELLLIALNCAKVPAKGAETFWEACQSFWFVQLLIQTEASGHSISPGRFDQYMYPYYKRDTDAGSLTREFAQELIDCIFVKLNDINKCRDAASAEGFAGYSMFQNLIVGGQNEEGVDVTNDLSFMCLNAAMHVALPQPSLSIRIWNKTPQDLFMKAAEVTRTGIGLPAYYNDEVIIPALAARGVAMADARNYNIIGCVEPQAPGKTDGWHDAAFFNMCRPMELVFSNGYDNGVLVGIETGEVTSFTSFEQFYDAYKAQMNYLISLLVNAINAIDCAHAERCPLPFESSMVQDCIGRGKAVEQGGAVYNFSGPQGFGISNMADGLYAVKRLVFEEKKYTLADFKEAMAHNFGEPMDERHAALLTETAARERGITDGGAIRRLYEGIRAGDADEERKKAYRRLREDIEALPKFGNDIDEIDDLARDVAYTYTKPVQNYKNPRGGQFHAGLYPVSANVPLGAQTGATPDGRLAYTPIADGVSPVSGRDVKGPTAAANSVAKLDHMIASNGTLYNMKFHPSALAGVRGLQNFTNFVRGYFDQKGMHVQFNVVSRETLLDAQRHPEKYKSLVVRVAGYSALFTTLSRSLQDDIINRTEQSAN